MGKHSLARRSEKPWPTWASRYSGLGSAAAIEPPDIVMEAYHPSGIATAMHIGAATHRVVWQPIGLVVAVKAVVLALGAGKLTTRWEADFAAVGAALSHTHVSPRLLAWGCGMPARARWWGRSGVWYSGFSAPSSGGCPPATRAAPTCPLSGRCLSRRSCGRGWRWLSRAGRRTPYFIRFCLPARPPRCWR